MYGKWNDDETKDISARTGVQFSTKERVDLGRRLFGNAYHGTKDQNNYIVKYALDERGDTPRMSGRYLEEYYAKNGWDQATTDRMNTLSGMNMLNSERVELGKQMITGYKGTGEQNLQLQSLLDDIQSDRYVKNNSYLNNLMPRKIKTESMFN